jgi:hypothetical protein
MAEEGWAGLVGLWVKRDGGERRRRDEKRCYVGV